MYKTLEVLKLKETIEGLTKEINRLSDAYYEKTSDIGRQLCAERLTELQDRRSKLLLEV